MSKSPYTDNLEFILIDNQSNLIIAHLHMNFVKNKFDFLDDKIKMNVDILMSSEIKFDDSFSTGQFLINGFNELIRQDRNQNGGKILLYIREDIPTKVLSFETLLVEGFYVEIKLRQKRRLIYCSYNPVLIHAILKIIFKP